jgi:hypothetical protein
METKEKEKQHSSKTDWQYEIFHKYCIFFLLFINYVHFFISKINNKPNQVYVVYMNIFKRARCSTIYPHNTSLNPIFSLLLLRGRESQFSGLWSGGCRLIALHVAFIVCKCHVSGRLIWCRVHSELRIDESMTHSSYKPHGPQGKALVSPLTAGSLLTCFFTTEFTSILMVFLFLLV